jgi:predicted Zn-dependent protease
MAEVPELIERALALSHADDCIVLGRRSSVANIRWANNTTTTNGETHDVDLAMVSIRDGRVGVIERNHVPEDRLEDFVRESEAQCEGRPRAEDAMPLVEGDGSEPSDWRAPVTPTTVGVFEEFTPQLADMFRRADAGSLKTYGYAEHSSSTLWLATSSGVRRRHTQLEGKVDFTGKTEDLKRSAWAGQGTTTFRDVDMGAMFRTVGQRLEWSENHIDMPAGHYEVLLEPSAVGDLAVYQYFTSTARDADEGRTVFSKPGGGNRIGEKMMDDRVTLYSDPNEPGMEVTPFAVALASSSYASVFDNGAPAARTEWVRDGVLANLITTRHWAQKTGARALPFIGNIVFPSQGPSLGEMIASTERALLVTCLWYIRTVDPQTLLLTGLTRDGVFLVENGEVKGAVNNFRWNMSPVQVFGNVFEAGASGPTLPREFDEWGLAKMPPLRVADFNMSSVSRAT